MDVVAFIFARGGSKGLPGKNIRPLLGKPLIGWAIEQALELKAVRRVIVSTDSPEIAEVSREFGAETPFMRPAEFAQDNSSELIAWKHALTFLQKNEGCLPQVMVSMPVTAPLRLPVDVENCLDLYAQGGADVVVTVTDAHRNPYFNMVQSHPDGMVTLAIPQANHIVRRQDAPVIFDMTTVAYAADPEFVLSCNSLFEGNVKASYIPVERSIDIDTIHDFKIAEFLMTQRLIT